MTAMSTYTAHMQLPAEEPSRLGAAAAWRAVQPSSLVPFAGRTRSFGTCLGKNGHTGEMADAKAITATRWLKEPPT